MTVRGRSSLETFQNGVSFFGVSQDEERIVYAFGTHPDEASWRSYGVRIELEMDDEPTVFVRTLDGSTRMKADMPRLLAELALRGIARTCRFFHCEPSGSWCELIVGPDGQLAGTRAAETEMYCHWADAPRMKAIAADLRRTFRRSVERRA
jgi:hypothetical protein